MLPWGPLPTRWTPAVPEEQRVGGLQAVRYLKESRACTGGVDWQGRPSMVGPDVVFLSLCLPSGRRVEDDLLLKSLRWAGSLSGFGPATGAC